MLKNIINSIKSEIKLVLASLCLFFLASTIAEGLILYVASEMINSKDMQINELNQKLINNSLDKNDYSNNLDDISKEDKN